jgi:NADH-quinone oxidoreductase subunit A
MGEAYVPILIALLIGLAVGLAFMAGSQFFGPKRPNPQKNSVYECGMPPVGPAHQRFSVKFYLVAVLFILFDLEAVFIYPWAVVFQDFLVAGAGWYILMEMAFFLGILFLGWYYVLRRGALDWE